MDGDILPEQEMKGKYYNVTSVGNGSLSFEPVKVPSFVLEERRERIRRREMRERVRQNRERAFALSLPGLMLFTLLLCICIVMCYFYINLQSSASIRSNHISSLQKQIADLTIDNDATENRLDVSASLKQIKAEATKQLGMKAAKASQLEYYSVGDTDYMLQYEDIK